MSATLELGKKKKLLPIKKFSSNMDVAVKTKAGTNGKQLKTNQDVAIVETSLPHGVKLFCVCDGHGLNGHMVSAFIKNNLISTFISNKEKTLRKNSRITRWTLLNQSAMSSTKRS